MIILIRRKQVHKSWFPEDEPTFELLAQIAQAQGLQGI
jgi:hypothetical protein